MGATKSQNENSYGLRNFLRAVKYRWLSPRAKCHKSCAELIKGKNGLEVGGPSYAFGQGGVLPWYSLVGHLDNCNYGRQTIWEGAISEGKNFHFDNAHEPGQQFICEATNLHAILDNSYDFVLSSHALEHIANPLLACKEWIRVLRPSGTLVLLLPHKDGTFDHRRPVTKLEHLVEDFQKGVGEDDLTHLPEILELHDLTLDPEAGDASAFKKRSQQNLQNRCLHHHVFDTRFAVEMVNHLGLQIRIVEAVKPYHIIVIAQKPIEGQKVDNSPFLSETAEFLRNTPFASDKKHQS